MASDERDCIVMLCVIPVAHKANDMTEKWDCRPNEWRLLGFTRNVQEMVDNTQQNKQ